MKNLLCNPSCIERFSILKPLFAVLFILSASFACAPLTDIPEPRQAEIVFHHPIEIVEAPVVRQATLDLLDLKEVSRSLVFTIEGEILGPVHGENCNYSIVTENGQTYDLVKHDFTGGLRMGLYVRLMVKRDNKTRTNCITGTPVEVLKLTYLAR